MQSNWSDLSHRRQYSDRGSRQWDDSKDRWEERRESLKDYYQDSYHKYHGDEETSTERLSRSREYSDSPKRRYSKDSSSRDWSRQSPARRRVSSPTSDGSEKKRRRFTGDNDVDYRYRRGSPQETYRRSPDSFSHDHKTKDFKYASQHGDKFKNRKTSPESRAKGWRGGEFSYRKHDDVNDRSLSGFYKDKDYRKRKQDSSQEAQSPDGVSKIYTKTKEGMDTTSTSAHYEERQRNRGKFPANGCSGDFLGSDSTSADPHQKSSKGFQRFLDVLNKGVNVDVLTKIVTQTSACDVNSERESPGSLVSAADRPWSPSCPERQQQRHQPDSCWSEGGHRQASPQPRRRSRSSNRRSGSDENFPQRIASESLFGSRSKSPSVEKITLTPEDEQKHRHMQGVLQAIGVDLGFEELGQMSHRIQERLYGKKDGNRGGKLSREQATRQPGYSGKRRSRSSSSSRSSFSPLSRDGRTKKDSLSAQRDETDVHQPGVQQTAEYGWKTRSGSLQDSEECEATGKTTTSPFSLNTSFGVTHPPVACSPAACPPVTCPPVTPVMPMYSPANCSPLPFPALNPHPPSMLPPIRPGLFLPYLPPLFPYPNVPPPNMFPPIPAQTNPSLSQHTGTPQPQHFSLPGVISVQALNKTQKTKTQARPRCLQVIK